MNQPTTTPTPGPWKPRLVGQIVTVENICKVYDGPSHEDHATAIANAHLLAAAPDMLAALEFLLADYLAVEGPRHTASNVPLDKARAAINKAKGTA